MSQRALAAVDGRVLGLPRNVPNALVESGGLWHASTPRGGASGGLFTGCDYRSRITVWSSYPLSAAVPEMVEQKGIRYHPEHQVARVEGGRAHFTNGVSVEFDLLVCVPPLRPPRALAGTGLVDEGGWVRVDRSTMEMEFLPAGRHARRRQEDVGGARPQGQPPVSGPSRSSLRPAEASGTSGSPCSTCGRRGGRKLPVLEATLRGRSRHVRTLERAAARLGIELAADQNPEPRPFDIAGADHDHAAQALRTESRQERAKCANDVHASSPPGVSSGHTFAGQ